MNASVSNNGLLDSLLWSYKNELKPSGEILWRNVEEIGIERKQYTDTLVSITLTLL